jgi:hypothetical protein
LNAGLPGTGLGGLFYILSALWMPVDAVYGRMRGHKAVPWPVILRQAGIALGVIAALWLTGWAVGYLVAFWASSPFSRAGAGTGASTTVSSVIRWVGVVGTVGVLAFVIVLVQVLRFVVPRESQRRPPAATSREHRAA